MCPKSGDKMEKFNRSHYNIYANFVQDFLNKEKSFYQYKVCPELSVLEKKLLNARLFLRQGKFSEMLSLLNDIKSISSLFFEAEINILKSQAHSFLLDFQKATLFNLKAYELYKLVNDQFGIFISLYNLSVDYSRLNLDTISLHYLDLARNAARGPMQTGLILRADACRYSKENNVAKALLALQQLESILHELNQFDRMNSQTVMASIYVEIGRYDDALKHLENIENRAFFETKSKLQLDYILLKFLVKDSLIPGPEILAAENLSLHLRWKLLYLLSSGQVQMAQLVWKELGEVDPVFKDCEFCKVSGNDIFTKTLAKIYSPKMVVQQTLKGKLHDLLSILQGSPLPLSKEELIEKIWKVKYQPDFDDRLYKLIARLRKEFDVNIISKSSSYKIAI